MFDITNLWAYTAATLQGFIDIIFVKLGLIFIISFAGIIVAGKVIIKTIDKIFEPAQI